MPQNPSIIATKTISSQVYVFDLSKHPLAPELGDNECKPQLRLKGHRKEGYGLAFNSKKAGLLCSGSDDSLVCVWDINHALNNGTSRAPMLLQPLPSKPQLQTTTRPHLLPATPPLCPTPSGSSEISPMTPFTGHSDVVEDVSWHPFHENILASVSDDKSLKTWDTRQRDKVQDTLEAHPKEVNAVAFNPFSQAFHTHPVITTPHPHHMQFLMGCSNVIPYLSL